MSNNEDITSPNQSDWQLLDDYVQNASAAAFRELVRRHGRLVYASCLRMLGDSSLAEEAAQDAFILLASKAKKLDRKTVVAGWLHRAGWNICRMRRRSEERRLRREASEQIADWHAGARSEVWTELKPVLDEALSELSTHFRDVILLCYIEGLSQKQTADQLGCSESAVSKRLKKGIEQLRRLMAPAQTGLTAIVLIAALKENSLEANDSALLARIAEGGLRGHGSSASGSLAGPETQYLGMGVRMWMGSSFAALSVAGIALLWITLPNSTVPGSFQEPSASPAATQIVSQFPDPSAPDVLLSEKATPAAPRSDLIATRIERSLTLSYFASDAGNRERILRAIGIPLDSFAIEAVSANCDWADFERGLLIAWAQEDPLSAIQWRLAYSSDVSFLLEDWIRRDVDSVIEFLETKGGRELPYRDLYLLWASLAKTPLETREVILEAPSGADREHLLALLAQSWPKERLNEATPWARSRLKDRASWEVFSESLLLRLVQSSPSAAIDQLPMLEDSLNFMESARELARSISSHRPDETIDIYRRLKSRIRLEVAYPSAQGMGEIDFELAYAWSQSLPARERHQAFQGLMSVAGPADLKDVILEFLEMEEDPLMASSILDALGNNRRFPEEAADYALLMLVDRESLLNSPIQRQRALSAAMGVVGNLTLKGSFQYAANFLDQLPFAPEPEKRPLVERLISRWSIVNAAQAIEWIQQESWTKQTEKELTAHALKIDALFAPYR